MEFVILTGLSGAGKTRAMHAMEDIGFYCVDNLPPALIPVFYDLCDKSEGIQRRIAVVTDTRGGELFKSFFSALETLKAQNKPYKILFMDASEPVLVNRFQETRRKHPLSEAMQGSLEQAVRLEREMLRPVKEVSDYVIDTSNIPAAGLREHTGLEAPVRDYVMNCKETEGFKTRFTDMIDYMLPLYIQEGKSQLVIAVGCTGGHHRSVALAQYMHDHLAANGIHATVSHRDITKQ